MRRVAPAAARNREPILAVLRHVLPPSGTILEIASGSGEHAVHFARMLPDLLWQPSDPDPDSVASISAWRDEASLPNLLEPIALDATASEWPMDHADAILCINMVHISPWSATEGLMAGAERLLAPGASLVLYGPYRRDGKHTAPSNAAFDADLRARNPAWGVRDVADVAALAEGRGLSLDRLVEMPANNLTLVFRRI